MSIKDLTNYLPTHGFNTYGRKVELVATAFFFKIGIHSMQSWTATTRHGVTRKEAQKGLQDTENLFRKNLHLKDVC